MERDIDELAVKLRVLQPGEHLDWTYECPPLEERIQLAIMYAGKPMAVTKTDNPCTFRFTAQ